MNDQLFNSNYRNSHLEEANITVDELNFQTYRPNNELEPINKVPNPSGTFSHPQPRFNN